MAATSLRLHMNGINYRVDGIPRGASYKDVLCIIAKTANGKSALSESSGGRRLDKKHAKQRERLHRKTSERSSRRKEKSKGSNTSFPKSQKEVEMNNDEDKKGETASKRLSEGTKAMHLKTRLRSAKSLSTSRLSMDDSDIERLQKSHRSIQRQTRDQTFEESDTRIYHSLVNLIGSQRSQIEMQYKQLKNSKNLMMLMKNDVEKISVYYIDSVTDQRPGREMGLAVEDGELKSEGGDYTKSNAPSGRGVVARSYPFTDDNDSGVPSWESEETSSKDDRKQSFSYSKVCDNTGIVGTITPAKSCPVLSIKHKATSSSEIGLEFGGTKEQGISGSSDLTRVDEYKEAIDKEIDPDLFTGNDKINLKNVEEIDTNDSAEVGHESAFTEVFKTEVEVENNTENEEPNDEFELIDVNRLVNKTENKKDTELSSERNRQGKIGPRIGEKAEVSLIEDVVIESFVTDRQHNCTKANDDGCSDNNVKIDQNLEINSRDDPIELSNDIQDLAELSKLGFEAGNVDVNAKKIKENNRGSFIVIDFDDFDDENESLLIKDEYISSITGNESPTWIANTEYGQISVDKTSQRAEEDGDCMVEQQNFDESLDTKSPFATTDVLGLEELNVEGSEIISTKNSSVEMNAIDEMHSSSLSCGEDETEQYLTEDVGLEKTHQHNIKKDGERTENLDCTEIRTVEAELRYGEYTNAKLEGKNDMLNSAQTNEDSNSILLAEEAVNNSILLQSELPITLNVQSIGTDFAKSTSTKIKSEELSKKDYESLQSKNVHEKTAEVCHKDHKIHRPVVDSSKESSKKMFSWFKSKGRKNAERALKQSEKDVCSDNAVDIPPSHASGGSNNGASNGIKETEVLNVIVKDDNNNDFETMQAGEKVCSPDGNVHHPSTGIKGNCDFEKTKKKKKVTFMIDHEIEERKAIMKKYRSICNRIYKILENLLYHDLLIHHYTFELEKLIVAEKLYEDDVIKKDEKKVLDEILDFKEYLKSVTMFTKSQRRKIMEKNSEIASIDLILQRKNGLALSLEKCLHLKTCLNTPRILSRKFENRNIRGLNAFNGRHLGIESRSVSV